VSELAERRRREWRSGAIRTLLELETLAKRLRDDLEADPRIDIGVCLDEVSGINSQTMTLITYADRCAGLSEAGL
jgi:hypothetical protein